MKLFEIEQKTVEQAIGRRAMLATMDFKMLRKELTSLDGCPETVGQDFSVTSNFLTSLEGGPHHVGRDFFANDNRLTTLKGCPEYVGRHFHISRNNLTEIDYVPAHIGGGFFCVDNKIASFHNIHLKIKQLNTLDRNGMEDGPFACDIAKNMLGIALIPGVSRVLVKGYARLTNIFNEHIHDVHLLQDALIDAGYREQAQL